VNPDEPAELDALMTLVEEIGDHCVASARRFTAAVWLALENEPVFAPEHLAARQFTSVLT
jgi:hypothetical protein